MLRPSADLRDPHRLRFLDIPLRLVFWRNRLDGRTNLDPVLFCNPIFSEALATSPLRSMVVDTLHTVYLGVMSSWTSAAIWRVLLANPWGIVGTQEAKLGQGAVLLKSHLYDFFEATEVPADRQFALALSMLGDRMGYQSEGPALHPGTTMKLKAAETGVAFDWARALVKEFGSGGAVLGQLDRSW